jgi:predicted peroxiredoxin
LVHFDFYDSLSLFKLHVFANLFIERISSILHWLMGDVSDMTEKKSILYVQTSDMPERQYSPLVLAQTAKSMDLDAKVYYLGQGLRVLSPGEAKKIKMGSFPSVKDMIQRTLDMGIEIFVCEASKQMLGWEKVELLPGLKIVGAATLNDLALEADTTMWF